MASPAPPPRQSPDGAELDEYCTVLRGAFREEDATRWWHAIAALEQAHERTLVEEYFELASEARAKIDSARGVAHEAARPQQVRCMSCLRTLPGRDAVKASDGYLCPECWARAMDRTFDLIP